MHTCLHCRQALLDSRVSYRAVFPGRACPYATSKLEKQVHMLLACKRPRIRSKVLPVMRHCPPAGSLLRHSASSTTSPEYSVSFVSLCTCTKSWVLDAIARSWMMWRYYKSVRTCIRLSQGRKSATLPERACLDASAILPISALIHVRTDLR